MSYDKVALLDGKIKGTFFIFFLLIRDMDPPKNIDAFFFPFSLHIYSSPMLHTLPIRSLVALPSSPLLLLPPRNTGDGFSSVIHRASSISCPTRPQRRARRSRPPPSPRTRAAIAGSQKPRRQTGWPRCCTRPTTRN